MSQFKLAAFLVVQVEVDEAGKYIEVAVSVGSGSMGLVSSFPLQLSKKGNEMHTRSKYLKIFMLNKITILFFDQVELKRVAWG